MAEHDSADGVSLDEPKGGKKKLVMIIVGLLVLVGGAGAGLYFTGKLDSLLGKAPAAEGAETAEGAEGAEGEEHAAAEEPEEGGEEGGEHGEGGGPSSNFVPIPDMLVSLNTDDGAPRYLRLKVQLELAKKSDNAAVQAIMPRVVDQFQTYLREMRVEDLRGSKGLYRLQMELLSRVNAAAAPIQVKDVLFQEILVQ